MSLIDNIKNSVEFSAFRDFTAKGFSRYLHGDKGIWYIIFVLSVFSILAVYSATGMLAYSEKTGSTSYFILKHVGVILSGWAIIYGVHRVKYQYFSRFTKIILWIGIGLLIYTLMGSEVNDAKRWVKIPVVGITFQSSEWGKVAVIMYLANFLARNQATIKTKKTFFRALAAPVLVCGLIFPENFSTAAILMLVSVILLSFGGIRMKYIASFVGVMILLGGLLAASFYIFPEEKLPGRFATWKNRIESFAGSESDDYDQVKAAKIAIATSGIIGKMPGNSEQKVSLPHPYSDYIYAIIIEEYGLIGGVTILLMYLWLFARGVNIAHRCRGFFACFLVLGFTTLFCLQALVNMGVAVGFFPVTGQPLPFLSMGGSSTWFTAFGLGVILSVSASVERDEALQKEEAVLQNTEKALLS